MCIQWRGQLYVDRAWAFGNRGACAASQRFSAAVAWFFRTRVPPLPGVDNSGLDCHCSSACDCGSNVCEPYIDDSICVASEINATHLYNSFIKLVDTLHLQLSTTPGHISVPSTAVVALGVLYNTADNTISLPTDKLETLVGLLSAWLDKTSATPKDLASLAGKLLWAAQVVPPGRIFLGRVLATKRMADSRGRSVTLDSDFKADISWWFAFARQWNGKSFLEPFYAADVSLDASSDGWTDAGPGIGGFCFVRNEFFACGVPTAIRDWPICDLELLAFLLAARLWGQHWHSHSVSFLTDNEACRYFMDNGRSRDPRRLQIARLLVEEQFVGNYRLESARITTQQNVVADALSRLGQPDKWQLFSDTCSSYGVTPSRVTVSEELFSLTSRFCTETT